MSSNFDRKFARQSNSETEELDGRRNDSDYDDDDATVDMADQTGGSVASTGAAMSSGPVQRLRTPDGDATGSQTEHTQRGYVRYDAGPDRESLGKKYGITIASDGGAAKLQRLESDFGSDRVHRWADEGMPVAAMGKPKDMRAFRERKAERSDAVPDDIERRNQASVERNTTGERKDSPAGSTGAPDSVRRVISSQGRQMDETVQREMEEKLGGSFADVQLHTGPRAAAAADSIGARAFTVGNHVAFNRGEYRPETTEGKGVLAHELTHVRQQTDGRVSLLAKPDTSRHRDMSSSTTGHTGIDASGMEMHVQPKLEVSSPDDPAEREAERIAERVIEMEETDAPSGDSTGATGESIEPSKLDAAGQRSDGQEISAESESLVRRGVQGEGKPLPSETRAKFGRRMGTDLSDVRIHTGKRAAAAAEKINAKAYTMGSDVAFASGNYDTASRSGQQLLAHELTHVAQQQEETDSPRRAIQRQATKQESREEGPIAQLKDLLNFSNLSADTVSLIKNNPDQFKILFQQGRQKNQLGTVKRKIAKVLNLLAGIGVRSLKLFGTSIRKILEAYISAGWKIGVLDDLDVKQIRQFGRGLRQMGKIGQIVPKSLIGLFKKVPTKVFDLGLTAADVVMTLYRAGKKFDQGKWADGATIIAKWGLQIGATLASTVYAIADALTLLAEELLGDVPYVGFIVRLLRDIVNLVKEGVRTIAYIIKTIVLAVKGDYKKIVETWTKLQYKLKENLGYVYDACRAVRKKIKQGVTFTVDKVVKAVNYIFDKVSSGAQTWAYYADYLGDQIGL